jgi:hypothetical protein
MGGFQNETHGDFTHDYAFMTAPPGQESEHSFQFFALPIVRLPTDFLSAALERNH